LFMFTNWIELKPEKMIGKNQSFPG